MYSSLPRYEITEMENKSRVAVAVIMVMACLGMRADAQIFTGFPPGNFSRAGCGTAKFCAGVPDTCEPFTSNTCTFISATANATQNSTQDFVFQLQGQSSGYVALGLSSTFNATTNESFYVCSNVNPNNPGNISFVSRIKTGLDLTKPSSLNSTLLFGNVSGQNIQCSFAARVPLANDSTATRDARTAFFIAIYNGRVNSDGSLAAATTVVRLSQAVDFSNATTFVSSNLTTTAAPATTAHAIGLYHTLSQVLLILFGGLFVIML
ncbi:hypothetical protein DPEC_G00095190 [Dallia pectoralis]|uniref:Uncharacterized protein n=1 Tax=Dallia pectoralis TaxID=75939 RepID=A0ACC2GVB0_DALPE|nr:hypothetical protein DPEC_G00095190 [Dallia pectoralis]